MNNMAILVLILTYLNAIIIQSTYCKKRIFLLNLFTIEIIENFSYY